MLYTADEARDPKTREELIVARKIEEAIIAKKREAFVNKEDVSEDTKTLLRQKGYKLFDFTPPYWEAGYMSPAVCIQW